MTSIDRSVLQDKAQRVFDILIKSPELDSFLLVGGTALMLQIKHRVNLEFDFSCYELVLPGKKIDDFISRLKSENHQVHEATDSIDIAQFKRNCGEDLRHYNRDYVINGVKLSFFVLGKNQQQISFYRDCETIQNQNMVFKVLALEGLKVTKILVLADRVRSRDLFDLMILVKDHALTIDDVNIFVKTLGHIDDPEHYRAVLTGIIPLDKCDEGLKPIKVKFSMMSIYKFFDDLYAEHDIQKAKDFYSSKKIT